MKGIKGGQGIKREEINKKTQESNNALEEIKICLLKR